MLLVTLAGCTSWIDQESACEFAIYEWSDDLLAHILTGDGSGSFDYDPEDTPREFVAGNYDPESGDYTWDIGYADGYWLLNAKVTGFGTVYHSGNLDLLHTVAAIDILGETRATVVRTQREACDMTIASWPEDDEDDVFLRTGVYPDDESFAWTAEDDDYEYQGGQRMNLSSTFRATAKDGSYTSYRSNKPEGYSDEEWSGECGDGQLYCEGTTRYSFEGGTESSYAAYDGSSLYAEVESVFDYAGDGTLTVTYADGDVVECTYDVEGDACTYECDDGQDGDC